MARKHTPTQLKARRARRAAIQRAMLKVLSGANLARRTIEGGNQCMWLNNEDVAQLAALEKARRLGRDTVTNAHVALALTRTAAQGRVLSALREILSQGLPEALHGGTVRVCFRGDWGWL